MKRISVMLMEPDIAFLEALVKAKEHPNRSEAIRYAVRQYRKEKEAAKNE